MTVKEAMEVEAEAAAALALVNSKIEKDARLRAQALNALVNRREQILARIAGAMAHASREIVNALSESDREILQAWGIPKEYRQIGSDVEMPWGGKITIRAHRSKIG